MSEIIAALDWIDSIATIIWLILILIMILILKNIHNLQKWNNPTFKLGIVVLVLVLIYPLLTSFMLQLEIGVVLNIVTLIATLKYKRKLKGSNMNENQWLWPQVIWLCLTTVYVALMLVNDYLIP
ncbi:MAG: hypothetical protein HKN00_09560 [Flavobacteriaceae bacterium]|nr:hypothetical protein [Bacteroidia bacterium]MBT8287781.1 hypothetical protein [Bacteroidia bacterium]NNF75419.1 hypothetical protein [Flavobacteriaceae bacterium]NNK72253.1 hypothetical protein [Flavobacteriaceae bacterium]